MNGSGDNPDSGDDSLSANNSVTLERETTNQPQEEGTSCCNALSEGHQCSGNSNSPENTSHSGLMTPDHNTIDEYGSADNIDNITEEAKKVTPNRGNMSNDVFSREEAMEHYNAARLRAWGRSENGYGGIPKGTKQDGTQVGGLENASTTNGESILKNSVSGVSNSGSSLASDASMPNYDRLPFSADETRPHARNGLNEDYDTQQIVSNEGLVVEDTVQQRSITDKFNDNIKLAKEMMKNLTLNRGIGKYTDLDEGISSREYAEPDADGMDLLSELPTDVVLKILRYLSPKDLVHGVSLVSKTWHSMAFDPSLWSVIDFRKYVISDLALRKLPKLCSFISYIALPDANDNVTDKGFVALAEGCPHLTTFIAPRSGSKLTDAAIIAFTEHCRGLRYLHLDGLDVTDATLKHVALNLTKLEYLSVCQVSTITDDGISEVFTWCRNLRHFVSTQNQQITDKCLTSLAYSSKSIRRLDLVMCNLNPSGIFVIGQLTNLEQVNLTQCKNLTSSHLTPILKGCKKLISLSLNLCKQVDDACINNVFTYLPDLRNIYLVSTIITDESLFIMAREGRSLHRIDIGFTNVTAEGARRVSEMCSTLRYFGLMRCDIIRDSAVEELVVQYPHIEYSTFLQDSKRLLKKVKLETAKETQS